jgi:putative ABC transport system ATP-binding protein
LGPLGSLAAKIILLADEPTGNLDSRTSVEIMAIFQQLNERGITVIMVTHEQDIAAYAKRNVIMRDGVILDDHLVSQRSDAVAQLDNGRARPPGAPGADVKM